MKLHILTEPDGSFSWRKGLTALCSSLFTGAVVGNLIKNDFKELPPSYMLVIGSVFLFYFAKTAIDNIAKKETP